MKCVVVIRCAVYCVVCGAGVNFFITGSVVSLSHCLFFSLPVRFSQGVEVLRSRLPTSLFEHASGGPSCPPTDAMVHNTVQCALTLLEPCNNRMCVIAKRLGSLHGRTCSSACSFLKSLHDSAHRFSQLFKDRSQSEP